MRDVQIVIAFRNDLKLHSRKDLQHRSVVRLIEVHRFASVDQQARAVVRPVDHDLVELSNEEIRQHGKVKFPIHLTVAFAETRQEELSQEGVLEERNRANSVMMKRRNAC